MTQRWNPDQYAANARFVSDLALPVTELLAPQRGERILDLGCGDGALTVRLRDLGCEVTGIDFSPEMIAAAKSRDVNALVCDAHALPFEREFDAVFSNAALHWMNDPARVIAGVHRSLKPGGRFVGEFGGQGNVAAIASAVEAALSQRGVDAASPWYFPAPDEYRRLLEADGFEVSALELIPRPTPLPGDMQAWLETFARPYFSALPKKERAPVIAEVIEALRPALQQADGTWIADYVRLRFAATKPRCEIR